MVITAIAMKKTCWDRANNNENHLIIKKAGKRVSSHFLPLSHSAQCSRFTTRPCQTLKFMKQKAAISHLDKTIWSQAFYTGILLPLKFQALLNFSRDWNGLWKKWGSLMVPVEEREMGLCCPQELWEAACGTGSGIYFRNCVKPEKRANPNKMFVFAEEHPASVTLTNAGFGQDALSGIPLQSHIQLPQLTEKMKTLLECVWGRAFVCLWAAWWFWAFWLWLGGFFFSKKWQCNVKYSMAFLGCVGFILTDPWGKIMIIPLLQTHKQWHGERDSARYHSISFM